MAFFKTASADIIGYKGSKSRMANASLEKMSDWNGYRTDDGFLYVRVRAISSRVNKNWDGWPSEELAQGYQSFVGKPIFIDHNNHDPGRTRGVIVDAALHVDDMNKTSNLDAYYATAPENHTPPTWVELLLEVDAKSFPKLAKAIINKDIDGVSMGANVEYTKCSHCQNRAEEPSQFCSHILNKGALFDYMEKSSGRKLAKHSYEDCYKVSFFEISFVFDPADETALVRDIRHAKTASMRESITYEGKQNVFSNAFQEPVDNWLMGIAREAWNDGYMNDQTDPRTSAWQAAVDALSAAGFENEAHEVANKLAQTFDSASEAPNQGQDMPSRLPPSYQQPHPSLREMQPLNNPTTSKTAAEGMTPQIDLTSIPQDVDTLRHDMPCPLCGNNLESGKCTTCGYEKAPEGLDNPDLTKAKPDLQNAMETIPLEQPEQQQPQQPPMNGVPTGGLPPNGQGQGGTQNGIAASWRNKFGGIYDHEAEGDFEGDTQWYPDWAGLEKALREAPYAYLVDEISSGQAPEGEVLELMEEFNIPDTRQNRGAILNMVDEIVASPENQATPLQNDAMDQPGDLTLPYGQQEQEYYRNKPGDFEGYPNKPTGFGHWGKTFGTVYLDLSHNVINAKTAANPNLDGGRINTQEKPLLPITRQVTDKPKNQKTISDSPKPVESKTKKEN